ncbi:MAG: hypothetical protein IKW45_06110 [Clostridia bacterium]|nr:hypothetical protein [Clostridia bacterium]
MAKKRFIRKPSKYEDQAILIHSVVTEIIERNKEYSDSRIKNVFRCKSSVIPEGRMCILWGRSAIEVGDEVQMKGRMIDNCGKEVFLVWSMMFIRRGENG